MSSPETSVVLKYMKWIIFLGLVIISWHSPIILDYTSLPAIRALDSYTIFLIAFPIFVILPLFGLLGALIADKAKSKGRSWNSFFWLSILVSPLVMFIIVSAIQGNPNVLVDGTKPCTMCAEPVKVEAKLCKHCGSEI